MLREQSLDAGRTVDANEEAVTLLRNWSYTGRPLTPAQILANHEVAEKRELLARQAAERKAIRLRPGNNHAQRVALDQIHKLERDLLQAHFLLERKLGSAFTEGVAALVVCVLLLLRVRVQRVRH